MSAHRNPFTHDSAPRDRTRHDRTRHDHTSARSRPRRRMRRGIARAALTATTAAGLLLAAPLAASAHVEISPDTIQRDGSTVLTFSFSHGCENSPTTALHVTMPEGLASVSPTVDSTWDIDVRRGDNGLVTDVTYSAVTPIPHDLRGAATMAIRLTDDAPEQLVFPVEQRCAEGSTAWVEVADAGQDPHDLDAPAPVVTVTDPAGSDHGSTHADTVAPSAPDTTGVVIGVVIGGAGLVVAAGALVVAVLAYRRSARR